MQRVTSRQNPRLRAVARLVASSRERRRSDRCVLEGEHLVAVYRERYGAPETLVISDRALEREPIRALGMQYPAQTLLVPPPLFEEIAVSPADVGILAVVPTPHPTSTVAADFCLLLDSVQDPGNVGSMLRSAAAAGVAQVMMSKHCAYAWSPKVLRAAQGAHFLLEIRQDVDLPAWAAKYREEGNVVAAVAATGRSLYATPLNGRLALAIGNEGAGVSAGLLAQATGQVTIPMPGGMESLNAAAAAAVILFECVRQRRSS